MIAGLYLERYCLDDTEKMVLQYHFCGMAPSQIDKELKLEKGTAHDTMCGIWARHKAEPHNGGW